MPAAIVAALAVLLLAGLHLPERAHAAPLDGVCDQMQAEADAFDGRVSYVVVDLTDWSRCTYQPDEVYITASLYKLIVLAEAYRQAELGTFSFDEQLAVYRPPLPDDEDSNGHVVSMSAREAVRLMIQISDNDAAEALRTRLDKPTVAALPAQIGMPNTVLGLDFTTTPSDIAQYFLRLRSGRLISPEADAQMLEVLLGQEVNDRIPWFLPDDVEIAHKTGRLERLAHDAGIIYAPGGPYLLVVLTEGAVSQEQGYEVIRSLAEISYTGFAEPRPPAAQAPLLDPLMVQSALMLPAPTPGAALVAAEPAPQPAAETDEASSASDAPATEPAIEVAPAVSGGSQWWEQPVNWAGIAGVLALVPIAFLVLRRRPEPQPPEPVPVPIDYRAERPVLARVMAGDGTMRMKSKKEARAPGPAEEHVPEVRPLPADAAAIASPRLKRLAAYFRAQFELLEDMSHELEAETAPLLDLLARQNRTVDQVLVNLDERLGPLREYNETEQANLEALEERIEGEGMDFVARSFSDYVAQQHQRIAETRRRIDAQREPFEQLALDERDAVELALSRFDSDIGALEGNLAEQRKVLTRLLDALRSDDFGEVTNFLSARQQALSEAATRGVTDPSEIAAQMHELRRDSGESSSGNAHLHHVLEGTQQADERLITASDRPSVRALGPAELEGVSDDDEEPEQERTTA